MTTATRTLLSVTAAAVLAVVVWAMLHAVQGGWPYVAYLVLFPPVRMLAWAATIEGWGLLAVMVGYAVALALVLCSARKTATRGWVLAAHLVLASLVLLKEWPYWAP